MLLSALAACLTAAAAEGPRPPWPEGRRAALSLSFDDARPSQVEVGTTLLDRYGVKVT